MISIYYFYLAYTTENKKMNIGPGEKNNFHEVTYELKIFREFMFCISER